ncbi:MAG: precorrin-3B C(17)-methyltransferase [Chloroflexota bacterium]|jgi:precorrin-3B C17-methyltransferase
MTLEAKHAIETADVIVGYKTYVKLVQSIVKSEVEVFSGVMGKEVERAKYAITKAIEGKQVAVISSGDSGVYGMAGVVLEVADLQNTKIPIKIIPGVTAATAAAALLGAPLVSDFAVISLSDLLTPWSLIEKRLHAAAEANFVIVLYNPKSEGRKEPLMKTYEILLQYRRPETPVGIVKQVGRKGEETMVAPLKELLNCEVDMTTTIVIGNSTTRIVGKNMVTPRGYNL